MKLSTMSASEKTETEIQHVANQALLAGLRSGCQKSARGVAIWNPDGILALGTNYPASGVCDGSEACRRDCPRICVHAEQDALRLTSPGPVAGRPSCLLHVKVDRARQTMIPSGPPSCVECSKLILAAGIETIYLLHENGWQHYDAERFHRLSLEHHRLHYTSRQ